MPKMPPDEVPDDQATSGLIEGSRPSVEVRPVIQVHRDPRVIQVVRVLGEMFEMTTRLHGVGYTEGVFAAALHYFAHESGLEEAFNAHCDGSAELSKYQFVPSYGSDRVLDIHVFSKASRPVKGHDA